MESKERISIRNFAGIEELEMDIKPINILIGPQGVGKSVVVKLIYFFRECINSLIDVKEGMSDPLEAYNRQTYSRFIKIFDRSAWNISNDTVITYHSINGMKYTVNVNDRGIIQISTPEIFKEMLSEIRNVNSEFGDLRISELGVSNYIKQRINLENTVRLVVAKKYTEKFLHQLFIPAGRSFFSTVNGNVYSIIENEANSSLDTFMLRFGTLYQVLGEVESEYNIMKENNNLPEGYHDFDTMVSKVIGGKYVKDVDDLQYIVHRDNRKVELNTVSSGQQESLPLLLILKAIYNKLLAKDGSVLYIEEPEAHLFPTAQKAIVELLAKTYNSNPDNTIMFITTHSPYILTSFNNLIYAGNIIKDDESKREAVEKVIAKDTLLDCSQIGAYALTKDGLKDLIDQENHIINAELLDEVSNMIGREFDQLLDIEYAD